MANNFGIRPIYSVTFSPTNTETCRPVRTSIYPLTCRPNHSLYTIHGALEKWRNYYRLLNLGDRFLSALSATTAVANMNQSIIPPYPIPSQLLTNTHPPLFVHSLDLPRNSCHRRHAHTLPSGGTDCSNNERRRTTTMMMISGRNTGGERSRDNNNGNDRIYC